MATPANCKKGHLSLEGERGRESACVCPRALGPPPAPHLPHMRSAGHALLSHLAYYTGGETGSEVPLMLPRGPRLKKDP